MVDLSQFDDVRDDAIWLDPLTSPVNDDEFFVAKNNGLVFLVKKNSTNNQQAILDVSHHLNHSAFTSLTAIGLHPSFTLPEEPGYATFYTAHTTEFAPKNNHNRLILNETNIHFPFETVITAWTYDFDKQIIASHTQREVIRIPIKTPNSGIQQLTFDPYLKLWHADFGQLYFSLGYMGELQDDALYSGAILSISPMMFGARNYTVPQSNPFVKTPEINDEIVVMGGQHIEQFFWAKNSYESIFILHNNSVQHWLSKAKVGIDLRSQADFLRQQPKEMPSMMLYQGRDIEVLRNKMVFFTLLDNQWHVTSLALESLSNELPTFEKIINSEAISPQSDVSIHEDNQHEIIIFDRHQSKLYFLQSTNTKITSDNISQPTTPTFGYQYYGLIISLLAVLLAALWFIKRNHGVHKLAKESLHKEYVRFEYMGPKERILLFRINHKKAHKTLSLKSLTRCEVLLNNKVVNIIDCVPENAISNQVEAQIRALFTTEQNKKMLDEHRRQIQLKLSDKDGNYLIYLYLRKGNIRVTGAKFDMVVDRVIDLCWVISKQLHPQTETRIVPVVAFSRPNLPVSAREPLRQQHKANNFNKIQESPQATAPLKSTSVTQQTEFVEALEKLVNLHKQGYLSDEEFTLAKSNLLQSQGG